MKAWKKLLAALGLLALTAALVLIANAFPDWFFSFYPQVSRALTGALSVIASPLPCTLWELLVVVLAGLLIFTFVRMLRKKTGFLSWLFGVLLSVSAGIFLFVAIWGLNHYGPTVDESLGLPVRKYTKEELIAATEYYAAEASRLSVQVPRDEAGEVSFADFRTLSKQAGEGYRSLREQYPMFSGSLLPVKRILSWRLFSEFGTTGIFVCLTGESCVNPDTYRVWIPYTMCHELGHRQAVAAEDGANFCAYLACMASERVEFQYSGAFAAYIYCNNALYKIDRSAASAIWQTVSPEVRFDSNSANAHYAQYEGQIQEAATRVNDAYLKTFSEESGVQSYGEVADDLVAWYLQNAGN